MVFSKYTKARDVALALAKDSPYWPRIADSCVLRSLRDELICWRSESNWHSCRCCSSCILRSVHASSQVWRFSCSRTVTLWTSCSAGISGSWAGKVIKLNNLAHSDHCKSFCSSICSTKAMTPASCLKDNIC